MKKILIPFLIAAMTGTMICPLPVLANPAASLDGMAPLTAQLKVPGGEKRVTLSVTNESIRTVLRQLSQQGGFNLMMDESVVGNVTIELNNVTINEALQAVGAMSDTLIVKQPGSIFLAIARSAAESKGIERQLSKVINIYYSNARRIADVLNRSIFAQAGGSSSAGGAQQVQTARPDPRTNSVIVVGTAREIELAESAIARLDVPRQSKTFYLSHANALDIATMLASSIFNDGTASFVMGGSSGGSASTGSSGGSQAAPSGLRVERQDVQEGSGINTFGGGSGGGSGGGTTSAGFSSNVTLRGFAKATDTAQISPEGAMVIPDTRQNSVTIMGTAEQIALAESLIPTLDAQLPQVAIEASLVEISEDGVKELGNRIGLADGRLQAGFNNTTVSGVQGTKGRRLVGMPTVDPTEPEAFGRSGIMFSTNPLARNSDYLVEIRSLMTKNKARILANPTVVATHDTESIISIVDEIVRRVTTQLDPSGFVTQSVEIGEAGIVMDILPKVGEDGTVNLRLRPSVTTVRQETRDALGNIVTLLSKRDMLTQNVRVRDGETLVLGGLIQENETARADKLPGVGDLPIVGAMFRASQRNSHRSELVLLITPHIINKSKITPVNTTSNTPLKDNSVAAGMLGGDQ